MTDAPLTDQQLAEISARHAVATPGRWYQQLGHGRDFIASEVAGYEHGIGTLDFGVGDQADADREFVLNARADMTALLAALDQRDAENAQLRAEIREWLNLRQARTSLQAFRHAIGGTATQITELIHGIGRATGPLARAQREASYYRARWESTVVEARRQAARAAAAEQSLAEVTAWAHLAIYHSGGPACPTPATCTAAAVSAPTTSAEGCGCQSYTHPGHYPSCPTRADAPSATT